MTRLILVSGEWLDGATTTHAFVLVHMRATSTILSISMNSKWTLLSFALSRGNRLCIAREPATVLNPYQTQYECNVCTIVLTCRTRASNAIRCEAVLWHSGAVWPIPCNPRTLTINESMIFKLKEHTMVDWQPDRLSTATRNTTIRSERLPCSTCRMEFVRDFFRSLQLQRYSYIVIGRKFHSFWQLLATIGALHRLLNATGM